jgi:hypothetical protein
MFWKQIALGDHERGLVTKNGRFHAIFTPGVYRVFKSPGVSVEVEKFDSRDLVFRSSWAGYFIEKRPDIIERHFILIATTEVQIGMVYSDGHLFTVLTPAKRVLFWRGVAHITAEVVNVLGEPDCIWEDPTEGLDNLFEESSEMIAPVDVE